MPTTRPLRTGIAVALLASLALGACGDDAEPLSKADFVEEADAICADHSAQVEGVMEEAWTTAEGLDENDPDDREALFTALAAAADDAEPIMASQIDALRALEPPTADRELIDGMLDDLEAAVADFVQTTGDAADGDELAAARITNGSDDPFGDVNRQAREYGLTVCGMDDE